MATEEEIISAAMRLLSARRTPEGIRHSVDAMAAARHGRHLTEKHKAALRQAQIARRERERTERAVAGADGSVAPMRPRGRPRKGTT